MLNDIGGRKFLFGIILIVMGFVFVLMKMVNVDTFFTFAEIVGGTYIIGNVGATVAHKVGTVTLIQPTTTNGGNV